MKIPIFKDSVVIITGASSGIGRELALMLADQGACLALAARSADALSTPWPKNAASAAARPSPSRPTLSLPEQCRALVEATVQAFGRIDMLVNNAGITMWSRFDEVQDLSIFDQIMQVNYLGSVYCTYYALPYLKQTHGRIVAVSSLTGKAGVPTRSGYAASKHAMVGFFDILRIELEGSGVTVTLVYPGFVATGVQARGFGPDGRPLGRNPLQVGADHEHRAMRPAHPARRRPPPARRGDDPARQAGPVDQADRARPGGPHRAQSHRGG